MLLYREMDKMKEKEIKEIIQCLGDERTLYHYFKDRYALMLLSYIIGNGLPVRDLKNSRFGRLIQKPLLKPIIGEAGSGTLMHRHIGSLWPANYETYRLTLGTWGGHAGWQRFYNQTSRPGFNLVLQLNFSTRHNRRYHQMIRPGEIHPFESQSHPIAGNGEHTLAWARIDLSMATGEALIEEIQTDWLRMALREGHDAGL